MAKIKVIPKKKETENYKEVTLEEIANAKPQKPEPGSIEAAKKWLRSFYIPGVNRWNEEMVRKAIREATAANKRCDHFCIRGYDANQNAYHG